MTSKTPEELIDESFSELRNALADDVLLQVKDGTDAFFERLVVRLLVAMAYGGSIEDAGKAVGKSGDGGIDGIIKEDKLGLDTIVVQAKKWTDNSVGEPALRDFVGSIEGYGTNKGVFITTSSFTNPAKKYILKVRQQVVLIDGPTLAGLMIDHNVGVSSGKSFTLKQLDSDYFDE